MLLSEYIRTHTYFANPNAPFSGGKPLMPAWQLARKLTGDTSHLNTPLFLEGRMGRFSSATSRQSPITLALADGIQEGRLNGAALGGAGGSICAGIGMAILAFNPATLPVVVATAGFGAGAHALNRLRSTGAAPRPSIGTCLLRGALDGILTPIMAAGYVTGKLGSVVGGLALGVGGLAIGVIETSLSTAAVGAKKGAALLRQAHVLPLPDVNNGRSFSHPNANFNRRARPPMVPVYRNHTARPPAP